MKPLFLLFAYFLAAATEVSVSGQTSVTPNWIVGKPSDFQNTAVYQALSDFDGKHYESTVYGRDLNGVSKWKPGDELPSGISKIISNAQDAFQKQYPQFKRFKIVSANLIHLPAVDDWVFDVEFNGTDFAKVNEGAFEDKKINVIVLLSGRAITPIESSKR